MKSSSTVYIGPSLEHIVHEGTVFRNGYPSKFEDTIGVYPFLRELMVPVESLAEAKKSIRDPESSMSMLYRKAEKIRRK